MITPALNSYWWAVGLVSLGTFFIASAFFNVYAMAIDTLFLCLLEDLEKNDGSPDKPYYMSKSLMNVMGKKNKKVKKKSKDT